MEMTDIGKAAEKLTDAEFSDEISSHVSLTKSEIDKLFPDQSDREELAKLTDIVLNAADENQRKAALISNISNVAGTAVKLLKKSYGV